ncbi:aldehyde dehydrogenase [Escherichia coli]|nr:aldehyde dehydrogenase [Escherichia coli]PJF73564.1 aldehyde dehydrogenase [Escherichia coli]
MAGLIHFVNFIILFINKMRVVAFSFFIYYVHSLGNDSNLLIVFYVQIMPDDFVMQLHRF